MFMMPPIAADLAGTFTLSDRTELRVRAPGSAPADASLDIETAPEARLQLASRRTRQTLVYAPRLTFGDLTTDVQPTVLHAGSARVEWLGPRARMSLEEAASYGDVNFASAALAPGADGAQPRPEVVPGQRVVHSVSSTTTLASQITLRRLLIDLSVGYELSGGASAEAREDLPLQSGPFAAAKGDYTLSRQDHMVTGLSASQASFSSDPESLLCEVTEGWRHLWSRVTETRLTLGVSESRARASQIDPYTFETHPVAEAAFEHRHATGVGRVDALLGVRLGPVVNRLLGVIDERVEGTVGATHTRRRFVTHAIASASRSVPASTPSATSLVAAELGVAYAASAAVAFDAGVRGLWQRQEATQDAFLQGTFFVGVTVRAPPMRL